jgi:hypothetical protein
MSLSTEMLESYDEERSGRLSGDEVRLEKCDGLSGWRWGNLQQNVSRLYILQVRFSNRLPSCKVSAHFEKTGAVSLANVETKTGTIASECAVGQVRRRGRESILLMAGLDCVVAAEPRVGICNGARRVPDPETASTRQAALQLWKRQVPMGIHLICFPWRERLTRPQVVKIDSVLSVDVMHRPDLQIQ